VRNGGFEFSLRNICIHARNVLLHSLRRKWCSGFLSPLKIHANHKSTEVDKKNTLPYRKHKHDHASLTELNIFSFRQQNFISKQSFLFITLTAYFGFSKGYFLSAYPFIVVS
jgi:hypothetical protein